MVVCLLVVVCLAVQEVPCSDRPGGQGTQGRKRGGDVEVGEHGVGGRPRGGKGDGGERRHGGWRGRGGWRRRSGWRRHGGWLGWRVGRGLAVAGMGACCFKVVCMVVTQAVEGHAEERLGVLVGEDVAVVCLAGDRVRACKLEHVPQRETSRGWLQIRT